MRQFIFFVFSAILIAACGGGDTVDEPGDNTSSGSSTSTSSSSTSSGGAGGGGAGSSSSSTSSGGGGSSSSSGGTCSPSKEDPTALQCGPDQKCVCSPTFSSDEEWCTAAEDMELYICPEGLNVCTSDHNQCGYDLPEGEDYVPPDAECKKFIDGDTWVDEDADQGKALSEYDENGQLEVGFGVLSHSAPYFSNFKVSGKKIVWNRGNADSYESAEGEFGSDCEQITMRYYKGGKGDEIQPWLTRVIVWLHK